MDFFLDLFKTGMSYMTLNFYVLLVICLVLYYIAPKKARWFVLLLGSMVFYYFAASGDWAALSVFLGTVLVSYLGGLLLGRFNPAKRSPRAGLFLLILFSLLSLSPLLFLKGSSLFAAGAAAGLLLALHMLLPRRLASFILGAIHEQSQLLFI